MGIKKVAIKVNNPRIFRSLVQELRKNGLIPTVDSGDLTVSDFDRSADIFIQGEDEVKKAITYLQCLRLGKRRFDELLIGIDTNSPRLTVVIVGDGIIIDNMEVWIDEIEDVIEEIISKYPYKRVYIGVGTGNKYGELVYKLLSIRFPFVKKVNESRTSSKNPYVNIKDKDVRAAYMIALRSTKC